MNLGQRMRAAGIDPSAPVDPYAGPILERGPVRHAWLDRLRGLAIVLMVIDHLLVVADPSSIVRLTATRLAAPLFLLCMAALWRPGLNRRRLAFMVAAAGVELVTFPVLGIPAPGIMVGIIAITLVAHRWPRLARHGFAVAVAGFIGWIYLGLAVAVPVAWWGVGRIAPWMEVRRYGERLPAALEVIGRHPLAWYVGHLAVLALAVQSVTP